MMTIGHLGVRGMAVVTGMIDRVEDGAGTVSDETGVVTRALTGTATGVLSEAQAAREAGIASGLDLDLATEEMEGRRPTAVREKRRRHLLVLARPSCERISGQMPETILDQMSNHSRLIRIRQRAI